MIILLLLLLLGRLEPAMWVRHRPSREALASRCCDPVDAGSLVRLPRPRRGAGSPNTAQPSPQPGKASSVRNTAVGVEYGSALRHELNPMLTGKSSRE